MTAKTILQSELFYLLIAGVAMVVVWMFIKRGRLPEEEPSIFERILMFGGIVLTVTALLILLFRADVVQKPGAEEEEEEQELEDFSRQGSGCSKPSKAIKDFNN
jgi:type VI protein secretion system component VasK